MRVGSQIYKIFHAPKLLIECVFQPNFKGLNEKIEICYETKTRTCMHIALAAWYACLFNISEKNLGLVEIDNYW